MTPGLDKVKAGEFRGDTLPDVRQFLAEFSHVTIFYQGVFPETAKELPPDMLFSFVNLDMDVFEGTKRGLEYFYPRLVRGGIIACHDYSSVTCPGVKKAVDDFFVGKPEPVLECWHSQVIIVKM